MKMKPNNQIITSVRVEIQQNTETKNSAKPENVRSCPSNKAELTPTANIKPNN